MNTVFYPSKIQFFLKEKFQKKQYKFFKNNVFKYIILLAGISYLTGCGTRDNDVNLTNSYLLPELKHKTIHAIELASDQGKTVIYKNNDEWRIKEPVDFPANFSVINNFLRTLVDVEIGKEVKVIERDLPLLDVHDEGGISATIHFGSQQVIKLIFGNLSTPKNTGDGLMMGVGEIARRYIRVIIGDEDKVYLVPVSLVDLSSDSALWTDKKFLRIPSFKRLAFLKNDKVVKEFRRERIFGSLIQFPQADTISSKTLSCFENFLKSGISLGVENTNFAMEQTYPSAYSSLVIEDFLGSAYTFRFGTPILPDEKTIERKKQQASFMNNGRAEATVPFLVDAQFGEFDGNAVEKQLRDSNRKIVERYSNRSAHLSFNQFACIVEYFKG